MNIEKLENHKLYCEIRTHEELKKFMENHVFAVFDFMSLTKSIQNYFAPSTVPWSPPKNPEIARFINEVVLAEESDHLPDRRTMSHYDMYLLAMEEVGADTRPVKEFVGLISQGRVSEAFKLRNIPEPARKFTQRTFENINRWEIHQIVASFCYGREKVIPLMFQSIADQLGLSKEQCPLFYYYLERHIELDGDEHGPIADKMLDIVCETEIKRAQAMKAAEQSIDQRIQFWNDLQHGERSLHSSAL